MDSSLTTLQGRAHSCLTPDGRRSGWAVSEFLQALVAADNPAFQRGVETAQTALLRDLCEHHDLPLNGAGRLAVLRAALAYVADLRRRRRFGRGHNSLYDRGTSDRYYRRDTAPHWINGLEPTSPRVPAVDDRERAEYLAGFADFDAMGCEKSYT